MKGVFALLACLSHVSALVPRIYYEENGSLVKAPDLDTRDQPYQFGVNFYLSTDCTTNYIDHLNHDEDSCNAAYTESKPKSVKAKADGSSHGYGCMTVFKDPDCLYGFQGQGKKNFNLIAKKCIDLTTLPFKPGCIVIGSRASHEDCNANPKVAAAAASC